MPVGELKRWTVILVLVGMIMTIGGSYAIVQQSTRANKEDIACLEVDVEVLRATENTFSTDIGEINASVAVIENDVAWIKDALQKADI